MEYTDRALMVMKRYYVGDESTPEEVFERVATAIADAEETDYKKGKYKKAFLELMTEKYFIPNSPCMKNAGTLQGLLSACLVVGPIEDSRESINWRLFDAVEAMSWGSGVGYNWSRLRPKGDLIKSNMGQSSGPLSFAQVYDQYVGETIQQSAMRPGAQMGIMNDHHPDVWHGEMFEEAILDDHVDDFIHIKRFYKEHIDPHDKSTHLNILRKLTGFNISIAISDDFMKAVEEDEEWDLHFDGEVYRTVNAREMWDAIINSAWHAGDPGLFFIDTTNHWSTMQWAYRIEATNPCGEQPLPPMGLCNLGHLNLGRYIKDGEFDYDLFKEHIVLGVRFLDNVVTMNKAPTKEIQKRNDGERRIGLGTMGLADLFIHLGIRYGDPESIELTDSIYKAKFEAEYWASIALAKEKGEFPDLDREKFINTPFAQEKMSEEMREAIMKQGTRHAAVGTMAPTGTTAQIFDVSGPSLEAIFSWVMNRVDSYGTHEYYIPIYQEFIDANPDISVDDMPDYYVTTEDVSIDEQLDIMETAQKWIDGAISKTFNLPNSATRDDISYIYKEAHRRGLKGVTVYRDGSLASGQVQTRIKPKEERKRPKELPSITRKATYRGDNYYVNLTFPLVDGELSFEKIMEPQEMFISTAKGIDPEWKDAVARMASLCLRAGINPLEVAESLEVIESAKSSGWFEGAFVNSEPALVGRLLREHVQRNGNGEKPKFVEGGRVCPVCGKQTVIVYGGCDMCVNEECGHSNCK